MGEGLSDCLFEYEVNLSENALLLNHQPVNVEFAPDDLFTRLPLISLYPYDTPLKSVARLNDGIIESVRFLDDSAVPGEIKKNGMCCIISNKKITDAEVCTKTVENGKNVYTRPSGSRTLVGEIYGGYDINGSPARFLQDGKSGNNQELGICLLNSKSGNIFCFYEYTE